MDILLLGTRLVLAAVLIVSGCAKLLDRAGTIEAYDGFQLPPRFRAAVGFGLPIGELILAIALFPARLVVGSALAAALLFGVFSVLVGRSVLRGEEMDCHCFGQLGTGRISWWTVGRNLGLTALAVMIWTQSLASDAPSFLGQFSTKDTIVAIGFLSCAVAIGGLIYVVVQLMAQQGRMLQRLEELEAADRQAGTFLPRRSPMTEPARPLPTVQLLTLDGTGVDFASLHRDTPLLVLFTSPTCGPCNALMPDIRHWQDNLNSSLAIAIVSKGTSDSVRAKAEEHGLVNVLLQNGRDVNEAFGIAGTPSAVVIDGQGLVRGDIARGTAAIRTLVADLQRGYSANDREEPKPLRGLGQLIPRSPVRGLDGRQRFVGGPSERGQMLIFWSPTCSHCQRMLDDLKRLEPSWPAGAPDLVVMSRGTPEANLDQGIQSLVVLDEGSDIRGLLGVRGTPSAILLNREGRVASNFMLGAKAIIEAFENPPRLGGRTVRLQSDGAVAEH